MDESILNQIWSAAHDVANCEVGTREHVLCLLPLNWLLTEAGLSPDLARCWAARFEFTARMSMRRNMR